ncbi:MAG TPA: hypothetical protein VFW48_04200, partial [Solirubrobacterales bacterium]|nr:hypothetical protein [Solirubrobacterales bacterium]
GKEQTGALCKENASPCPFASRSLVGSALEASAPEVKFTQFGVSWNCTSTLKGKVKVGGGASVNADFSDGTFGNCSIANGSCTAGKIEAPGSSFTASGGGNGTLTLNSLKVTMNCTYWGTPVTCIYANAKVSVPVTGGSPAKAVGTNVPMERLVGSSEACGATLSWSGTYSFSQPSPMFLTS